MTWSMINGDDTAGFTYHYINEKVDDGNIILKREMRVEEFDTQITLYHRIMFEAAKYFEEVLRLALCGYKGRKQRSGSYYERGCPFNGEIDENWSEEKIERFIRAMIYPPLPCAKYKGNIIHTWDEFKGLHIY